MNCGSALDKKYGSEFHKNVYEKNYIRKFWTVAWHVASILNDLGLATSLDPVKVVTLAGKIEGKKSVTKFYVQGVLFNIP